MSGLKSLDRDGLRRQLQAHLQSLRGAGVEWLPRVEPLPVNTLSYVVGPTAVCGAEPGALFDAAPSSSPAQNLESRHALAMLAAEIKTCARCPGLAATRTQTVFGDGQAGAELCFVGEAPGADE